MLTALITCIICAALAFAYLFSRLCTNPGPPGITDLTAVVVMIGCSIAIPILGVILIVNHVASQ